MTTSYFIRFLLLSAFLVLSMPYGTVAEAKSGAEIFKGKGCGDCHAVNGSSNLKEHQDRVKQKGPDIWFAGSKFKKAWLETWLQNPSAISGIKYSTLMPVKGNAAHPGLSGEDASAVTAFLMTLKDEKMATGIIDETKKMPRSLQFRTKALFEKKQVCFGCHQFKPRAKGKAKGGFSGPTLVEAGKRLRGDWVYSFLKDQKRYVSFGRMPVYMGPTFQAYSDKELKLLSQYIVNLK